MKLSCDIYKDLLLLYEDGLCSEDTKKLVEEHLAGCDRCSRYFEKMHLPEDMVQEEAVWEEQTEKARAEEESIRKSFRKIRRRWALSLLVIPLLLLLSGPVMMIVNEVRGEGICFTNLDDIWRCHRFWKLIADEEYEKAVEMLDFSYSYPNVRATLLGELPDGQTEEIRQFYYDIYGDVLNMTEEEFNRQEQQKIAAYLRDNQPVLLRSYHLDYGHTYKVGDSWVIGYKLVEGVRNPDKVGKGDVRYTMNFSVTEDGLVNSGSSIPGDYLSNENPEKELAERVLVLRENLVLYNMFHILSDEVSMRIYEWHQSQN